MAYSEYQKETDRKQNELRESLRKIGIHPITQHPDYEYDLAYDIDDIVDYIEHLKANGEYKELDIKDNL